jgi:hypothetical protein
MSGRSRRTRSIRLAVRAADRRARARRGSPDGRSGDVRRDPATIPLGGPVLAGLFAAQPVPLTWAAVEVADADTVDCGPDDAPVTVTACLAPRQPWPADPPADDPVHPNPVTARRAALDRLLRSARRAGLDGLTGLTWSEVPDGAGRVRVVLRAGGSQPGLPGDGTVVSTQLPFDQLSRLVAAGAWPVRAALLEAVSVVHLADPVDDAGGADRDRPRASAALHRTLAAARTELDRLRRRAGASLVMPGDPDTRVLRRPCPHGAGTDLRVGVRWTASVCQGLPDADRAAGALAVLPLAELAVLPLAELAG